MLLVGEVSTIALAIQTISIKERFHVVNLSSANITFGNSSLFYVPRQDMESNMYDIEYANFILNNTQQRIEFLYLIHQLLLGNHVLIMIGNYPGMYEMAESLLKLIQTRYGYRGYFISNNDIEDLSMFEARFSVPGLMLFDQEKVELDEIFLQQERGY